MIAVMQYDNFSHVAGVCMCERCQCVIDCVGIRNFSNSEASERINSNTFRLKKKVAALTHFYLNIHTGASKVLGREDQCEIYFD